ncbi:hypothetical protein MMC17_002284 [Xylographa soralifera]|nr:hypothetical protein [Xylographa soralifera]
MSDNDDSDGYILFAVFCTAEIPAETLNEFLTLSFARSKLAGCAAVLLTRSATLFLACTTRTHPPIKAFHSPYLRKSVSELVHIFEAMLASWEGGLHADSGFLVLDEQTLTDATACGVSLLGGVMTMRADFHMAVVLLGPGQILSHSFDEVSYAAFYARGEPLTLQGWERQKEEWEEQGRVAEEEKRRAKQKRVERPEL